MVAEGLVCVVHGCEIVVVFQTADVFVHLDVRAHNVVASVVLPISFEYLVDPLLHLSLVEDLAEETGVAPFPYLLLECEHIVLGHLDVVFVQVLFHVHHPRVLRTHVETVVHPSHRGGAFESLLYRIDLLVSAIQEAGAERLAV